MPNYEYRCDDCAGKVWEVSKSMKESDREEACPTCGKVGIRHFSAPNPVHFRGQGWYHTTYGAKNPGNK